ncbi:MAG: L-2-amino-thiazoline-4-carboxylic acid hydrolase [Promethearchaeota archaeon]|jgi:hypothetical protein
MPIKVISDFYIKKKQILIAQFENYLQIVKELLKKKFSDPKAEELINQMRKEYESIIPEIPYIGGRKNVFTNVLIDKVSTLAIIRILEKEGYSFREIGEFNNQYAENIFQIRKDSIEKVGQDPLAQSFDKGAIALFKKYCINSLKKDYPDDWVMEFVEGDGMNFDYGFNISECGILKAYKKLGAEKYVPFLCLYDLAMAHTMGFGLNRTQTLANGAPKCDHRYLRSGKTSRAWPPDEIEEYKMG